jgi:hypothetical protein
MWQDRRATIDNYMTLGGGSRFGVYDITTEIAAGGMAVAWRDRGSSLKQHRLTREALP